MRVLKSKIRDAQKDELKIVEQGKMHDVDFETEETNIHEKQEQTYFKEKRDKLLKKMAII